MRRKEELHEKKRNILVAMSASVIVLGLTANKEKNVFFSTLCGFQTLYR